MRVTGSRWMVLCAGVLALSACSGEDRSSTPTTVAATETTAPRTTAAETSAPVTDDLVASCLGGPRPLDDPTVEVENTSGLPVTLVRPDSRNQVGGATVWLASGYLHHRVREDELTDVVRVEPDGELTPVATVPVVCWVDVADTSAGLLALVGTSTADGGMRTVLAALDDGGAILDELTTGPVSFDAVTEDWVAYSEALPAGSEGGTVARVVEAATGDVREYELENGVPTIVGRWMFSHDEETGEHARWDLTTGERDGLLPGAPGPATSCATETRLVVLAGGAVAIVDPDTLEVIAELPADEGSHLGACGSDTAWLLHGPAITGSRDGTDARGGSEACPTFDDDPVVLREIDDRDADVRREWSFTALVDRYGGPSTLCSGPHLPELAVSDGQLFLTRLAAEPADSAISTIWRLDP